MNIYERFLKEQYDIMSPQTPEPKPVSEELQKLLDRSHLTLTVLSDYSWIARPQLKKILDGKVKHPALATMIAICVAFGLNYGQSMQFLKDTGYNEFDRLGFLRNDLVLYNIVLKSSPSIIEANLILMHGINQVYRHNSHCDWMPTFLPGDKTFVNHMREMYPESFPYETVEDMTYAMFQHRDDKIDYFKNFRQFEWED